MTTYFKNSKKEGPQDLESSLGAVQGLLSTPNAKIEYCDGGNWYTLATEDFVKNRMSLLCDYATTSNLSATYDTSSRACHQLSSIMAAAA